MGDIGDFGNGCLDVIDFEDLQYSPENEQEALEPAVLTEIFRLLFDSADLDYLKKIEADHYQLEPPVMLGVLSE